MKIIAVDPGYDRAGFAIISGKREAPELIHSECLETNKEAPYEERLFSVGKKIEELINLHKPECMAIEALFFAKNKKTALRVSEIRGMCVYIAKKCGIEISEYTPNQVKNAVTGNSNADKKQIMRMVPLLIQIQENTKRHDDEYDAIAIGITHLSARKNEWQ